MKITLYPIGKVSSTLKERNQKDIIDENAIIEINKELTDGLKGLEGFSHIIVVFYMDRIKSWKLLETPKRHNPKNLTVGVFATRSPYRPNRIGISIVKLNRIQENLIYFTNKDILDGSPVLDIKPYLPVETKEPKLGWYKP